MFVPLIPYESKILLVCPICSRGVELGADQWEKAKHLNRLAKAFLAKELPENEYIAETERIRLLPTTETAGKAQQEAPRRMSAGKVPVIRLVAVVLVTFAVVTIYLWSTYPATNLIEMKP